MTLPRVLLSLLLAHGAVCGTRGIPSPYEPDTAIKFARFRLAPSPTHHTHNTQHTHTHAHAHARTHAHTARACRHARRGRCLTRRLAGGRGRSHAAYCDSALLGNWTCIPCLTVDPAFKPTVIQNTSTGVQAFVGSSAADIRFGDLIVIGFRGTVNWDNWIHNLEVPKTRKYSKCANCAVHEGFLLAPRILGAETVSETAKPARNPRSPNQNGACGSHFEARYPNAPHFLEYIYKMYTASQGRETVLF